MTDETATMLTNFESSYCKTRVWKSMAMGRQKDLFGGVKAVKVRY